MHCTNLPNALHYFSFQVLGSAVFTTSVHTKKSQTSLKSMLEDEAVLKIFLDPRPDSDALYHHYGVHLKNCVCLQLAEIAVRRQPRPTLHGYVNGGRKIILAYGELDVREREEYVDIEEKGKQLLFPDQGGSYGNLTRRPLDPVAAQYSALATSYFMHVYVNLEKKLTEPGKNWVMEESRKRVEECLLPKFGGRGKFRALAPPHWK